MTEAAIDGDNTVDSMPRPDGLSRAVEADEHPIDVTIDEVRTTWLPVPYPTTRVDGLRGSWFWDDGSLTVRGVDADTGGQRYQATWLEVDPTPSQLRSGDRGVPDELAPFLALPDDLPQVIADTTAEVTEGAATPYDAAVAIQAFLRSPDFEYSTEAPVEEGYDGGGFDVIAQFLETQGRLLRALRVDDGGDGARGRASRLASRSATRREAHRRNASAALQRVEVDSHDLHAWPELYFEGVGWVPFEPTPGRGIVPDYSRPAPATSAGAPVPQSGSAAPSTSGRAEVDPGGGLVGMSGGLSSADSWWLRGGVIALLVAAILLAPAALRAGQRASRARRIVRGERPADAAWDRAHRDGPRSRGRRRHRRHAARGRVADRRARGVRRRRRRRAALIALRDAVERERYGPAARGGRIRRRPDRSARHRARRARPPMSAVDRVRAVARAPLAGRSRAGGIRRTPIRRRVESSIVAIKHSPFR